MAFLSSIVKLTAISTALFAVIIGLFVSGAFTRLGLYRYLDSYVDGPGNTRLKGLFPVMHDGIPFGFTMDELPEGSLQKKTYIVTGANVGLGYWTAQHLASRGGHVVMGCRTPKKCEQAASEIRRAISSTPGHGELEPMQLDLGSYKSIHKFANAFASKHDALHSLILNAGIMATPFGLTEDGVEQQIGVNHFGHFYLTKLLVDTLAKSATDDVPTTVSVVSSGSHYQSYPEGVRLSLDAINDASTYNRVLAYGQSKLANVLFAQELAKRVADKGILVNSLHPGGVDTALMRSAYKAIHDSLPKFAAVAVTDHFLTPAMAMLLWHPREGALTQVYTAVSPKLISQRITGQYFHPVARQNRPDAVHAFNATLQTKLWDLSEQFVADHAPRD